LRKELEEKKKRLEERAKLLQERQQQGSSKEGMNVEVHVRNFAITL
jgi:hypothetical protein